MKPQELFPDIAAEAQRMRRTQQALRRTVARQKIKHFPEEWPGFVLRQLRERGPSTGQAVYDGLREIGVSSETAGDEFYTFALRLHALMFVMADAGVLWRHDWDDEIAVFGIRGEHSKTAYLAAARGAPTEEGR